MRAAQGFRRAADLPEVKAEMCSGSIFKTVKSHLLIVCFQQWLKNLGEIQEHSPARLLQRIQAHL